MCVIQQVNNVIFIVDANIRNRRKKTFEVVEVANRVATFKENKYSLQH